MNHLLTPSCTYGRVYKFITTVVIGLGGVRAREAYYSSILSLQCTSMHAVCIFMCGGVCVCVCVIMVYKI